MSNLIKKATIDEETYQERFVRTYMKSMPETLSEDAKLKIEGLLREICSIIVWDSNIRHLKEKRKRGKC